MKKFLDIGVLGLSVSLIGYCIYQFLDDVLDNGNNQIWLLSHKSIQIIIVLMSIFLILMITYFILSNKLKSNQPINSKHLETQTSSPKETEEKPIVKYIRYDVFRWRVSILNNKYNVAKSPICLICCIPIDFFQNQWDGTTYQCAKCTTNYNKEHNIPQIRKALILELKTHGLNRIKTIYDKPC